MLVTLTDEGRDVVDEVAGAIFDRDDQLLAVLGPDRREALADLLRHLSVDLAGDAPVDHVGRRA